ncbi:MAG: phosphatidylserine decarboxylase family protein [Negativicoccus succinicivorans]|nr:phosphatidylserine decarboxylase family protein [Negativicoccus succinicivorans]MBS5917403.1 phosphatidylserine decarboxylase family protein [Negativicoccus succinicivorans]
MVVSFGSSTVPVTADGSVAAIYVAGETFRQPKEEIILSQITIVKEGYPFIGGALFVALLTGLLISWHWALLPFLFALFFTFFFRSPRRNVPRDPDVLVSPADGTVMRVEEVEEELFLGAPCYKVTIFLSVFDVHVNRSPMAGDITFRQYTCGGFRPAFQKSVGYENERHTIGLENERISIVVTQIAGLLARRIVSWKKLGDRLGKGELYGMIKFGSCTEVFMPKNVAVCVKKGDRVRGGETVIGRIVDA